MKRVIAPMIAGVVLVFSSAQADDRHHPEKGKEAAATPVSTPASPAKGMGMGMMDMERMQEMRKTMERIQQSKDPAERQRLMDEHMKQMHEMMGEMHSMMGKGMGRPADESQQMMEKRIDMMQGMMEQMMEHMMRQEGKATPQ